MPDVLNTADTTSNEDATAWVWRLFLRFGVGIGLAYAGWLVALQLTGNNAFGPKRVLAQFAVPPAVVLSQWMLRRVLRPGKPGLGRALAVGLGTAVVAATLAAASLYGLGAGVGESAMVSSRAELVGIAQANKPFLVKQLGGEAAYQKHLEQVSQLTIADLAKDDFTKILILGLVLAVPAAVFLRE